MEVDLTEEVTSAEADSPIPEETGEPSFKKIKKTKKTFGFTIEPSK